MQWKQIVKLGRELPEVAEDIWFRTPALKVRGKSFVRLKEDGENIVFLLENVEEQEALCEAMSDVYWITDHYRGYPAVMARLSALTEAECRARLERAWRQKAPRKLIAQHDLDAEARAAKTATTGSKAKPTAGAKVAARAKAQVPASAKAKPGPAKRSPARAKSAPARARRRGRA